ncbi:MAG: 6-phosphogluconolactonase [archaeon]
MISKINNPEQFKKKLHSEVKKLLQTKEHLVFGLPGGRSIESIFPLIKDLPWERIHVFMVDERLVSIDDMDSNYKLLHDGLFKNMIRSKRINEKNLHPIRINADMDNVVKKYSEELRKYGGFDIVFFGVGEDGHIAGLFPNLTIDNESEHYFAFTDSPKPPSGRVTASKKMLLRAKLGVFLFIGKSKKPAYEKFISKDTVIVDCPAKIAQHMNSLVYTHF